MAREVIKEFENFTLEHVTGVGNNDTPYEELEVRRKGLAEKHVVDIDLRPTCVLQYVGKPIKYTYRDVHVKHGFSLLPHSTETVRYHFPYSMSQLSAPNRYAAFGHFAPQQI